MTSLLGGGLSIHDSFGALDTGPKPAFHYLQQELALPTIFE
jgi:hypothetical protein